MKTILIVDDDPDIRRLLQRTLGAEETYRLLMAGDVAEAKDLLQLEPVELVITDVQMPGETGLELAWHIKEHYPETGVIIASVVSNPEETRAALEIGLYGYILKPFDRRQIVITVTNALRRQELEIQERKKRRKLESMVFKKNICLRESVQEAEKARADLAASNKILQDQLLFMQALLDAIPHPVFYKDLNGLFLGCNGAFETFFGTTKEEIVGREVDQIVSTEIAATAKTSDAALVSQKANVSYEIKLKDHNGHYHDVIITKALYLDAEDQPSGIVGILLDITYRKKSEAALQTSEEKLRQIMDNLTIGVMLISPELKILQTNRQMREWFPGIDMECEQTCHSVLQTPQREQPCNHCPSLLTLEDGEIHEVTSKIFRLGRWCDFRSVASPICDSDGKIIAIIMLFEDITDRLSMERELLQSQKMASIGQLAAGVAHEINNPTGFVSSNLKTLGDYQNDIDQLIQGYQSLKDTLKSRPASSSCNTVVERIDSIEALESQIDLPFIREDIQALISESREGTERIKRIVEDLKHFAHPGQDKVQDTDINRGIETTLNIVNNELKYNSTVIKDFGELPIILANPQQLNQVFANILVNAAHAMEKNGEIRIRTRHAGEHVKISISDNGCGIPEDHLERIFEPFFTTKEVGKGTGLGMNIAYNIIKKHGGDIQVTSCVGEGTTFTILLPANKDVAKATSAEQVAAGAE